MSSVARYSPCAFLSPANSTRFDPGLWISREVGSTKINLTDMGRKIIWGEDPTTLKNVSGLPDHVVRQPLHSIRPILLFAAKLFPYPTPGDRSCNKSILTLSPKYLPISSC